MEKDAWLKTNCRSMEGRTAAVTGPTGGIGRALCRMLLELHSRLILLSRDREKTAQLIRELYETFPQAHIFWIPLDLESMDSVQNACRELMGLPVDVLILNAGVYDVENTPCDCGFHRIFTVNFLAPYFLTKSLLPLLEERKGKVIAVGSIAASYRHFDPENPQFTGKKTHLIYGNSKRCLMYACTELFQKHPSVKFAVAHPGLAYTGMSNHFHGILRCVLEMPMRIFYMKPEKAARSIIKAVSLRVPYGYWVGPGCFRIWGDPRVKKLRGCSRQESLHIFRMAEKMSRRYMDKLQR